MKNKIIGATLIIVAALCLIVGGAVLSYNKNTKVKKPIEEEGYISEAEGYRDLGAASLKDDRTFNGVKYTQNHLSTTNPSEHTSFTSVVFNETGAMITDKHIEIDFYDTNGSLVGTMESEIESLKPGESTVIFGIVMQDLSTASSFKVRDVNE